MDYIVIIPAYNEEGNINRVIDSIINQTMSPKRLIVVNDGSTDRTPNIVNDYVAKFPFIRLVNNEKKEARAIGSKIIRAFNLGFNSIDTEYDFVSKIDADLELPYNYFERIAEIFKSNPQVGIAGGTIMTNNNGKWTYENFSDEDHVKGAFKSYRKECLEEMGGLRQSIGWDTADEMLARYYGWEIITDLALEIKHYRTLGAETGSIYTRVKVGWGMYRLRYGFLITLISAIKAGYLNKPYVLTGFAVMWGWIQSLLKREAFMVTKEQGAFIRKFRLNRMKQKISR